MRKNLSWKVVLVLAVLALSIYLATPLKKINLGLDLKGGMHLVFQVVTDDAVNIETDQEIARLEEQLKRKNIPYETVTKNESDRLTIMGFSPDDERKIRDLVEESFREWDSSFLGNTAVLQIKSEVIQYLKDQAVDQAVETIRNRVDEFGVAEPTIQRQGMAGDRIVVELPGVDNPERVMNLIKTTALLEWKLVVAGPTPDEGTLLQEYGGAVPPDLQVLRGDPKRTEGGYYLVSRVATVTGKDLRNARRSADEWDNPAVGFSLNPDSAKRFENATAENQGRMMAIVLDGKVQSAPVIEERIAGGDGIIRGTFTIEDAEDLALVLRAGALPATIKNLENRTIGPSLGADSVRRGVKASFAALILVMMFMVFYYRLAGVNAVTALILNIILLGGALAYFKATLTVPGIAGIILTIGMAVDANVLVFERIREEILLGKSVLSSIATGFSRALRTILDANITTIIAAVFLFQFGTGPLKGFAVTLIIGILASIFTAVFVSRLIFDLTVSRRSKRESLSI